MFVFDQTGDIGDACVFIRQVTLVMFVFDQTGDIGDACVFIRQVILVMLVCLSDR
jgi:nitrogen regulatory protein PII